MQKPTSIVGTVVLCLFGLFWCGMTGVADYFVFGAFAGQMRSLGFEETQGAITKSEVETHPGSEAPTYSPEVAYRYTVKGHEYTSTRIRTGAMAQSDSWAQNFVTAHPVGQPVQVYYDAANPSSAMLIRGPQGNDLFLLLFMTPFNCIALGGIGWLVAGKLKRKGDETRVAGRSIRHMDDGAIHMRQPLRSIWFGCFVLFGFLAFIEIFAIAFPFGFRPPLPLVLAVFGADALLVISIGVYSSRATRRGAHDIVIDPFRKLLGLPAQRVSWRGKEPAIEVPFSAISHIFVEMKMTGDQKDYEVHCRWTDSQGTHSRLVAEAGNEEQAQDLARFLLMRMPKGVSSAAPDRSDG